MGQTFLAEAHGVVLKPTEEALQAFLGEVISNVKNEGFSLAHVLKPVTGWTVDGWGAYSLLPGESKELLCTTDIIAILEAGRRFHASTQHLPRPSFYLDTRTDPWFRADAAVWGERSIDVVPVLRPLETVLIGALAPLGPSQVIHGDLTGNVLLGDTPGIIDISPYYRPTAYAEGIIMADALAWHGQTGELLSLAGVSVPAIARGILFRIYTSSIMAQEEPGVWDLEVEARQYTYAARTIGLVVSDQ